MFTRKKIYTITAALLSLLPCIASAQTDVLKLRINGNAYSDETIVRFVSGATDLFDGDYDAWKLFSSNPQVPSLYTRIDSVSPLSINAMPPLIHKRTIGIYVNIGVAGAYSITPFELAPFQQGVCIMLEDVADGSYYDMRAGLTPSFILPAGNNNGQPRFMLHINLPVAFIVSPATCYGKDDGEVILSKPGSSGWFYSLTDSVGNIIASAPVVNDADTVSALPAGTYNVTANTSYGCSESSSFIVSEPASMNPNIMSDTVRYLSQASIQFDAVAQGATGFSWDFGDGSPVSGQASTVHTYTAVGNYNVVLTVSDGNCDESVTRTVTILADPVITSAGEEEGSSPVIIPAGNIVTIENLEGRKIHFSVYNMLGQRVDERWLEGNNGKVSVRLDIPAGQYVVVVSGSRQQLSRKAFIPAE